MKVAVIGSGLAGLAATIHMANRGYAVHVYEKNARPGGKIFEIRIDGYRFDAGPSIFTLPELLEELYTGSGENISDFLRYSRLNLSCKYFYEDGTVIHAYDDTEKFSQELRKKTSEDPENLKKHLKKAQVTFDLGSEVFLFNSLYKLSNYITKPFLRTFFHMGKLDVFRTMHLANRARFRDSKLIRLFDRYATYNGSDPYRAPATLNMIAHLENNLGTFFPDEGIYSIVKGLQQLAVKKGAVFHFNSPVEKIRIKRRRVESLIIKGEEKCYDIIISDADIRYLHNNMLGKKSKKRFLRQEPSSSALIFYWGITRAFPELELHNVFFSDDYREEFQYVFKRRELFHDPTIYVFISSKHVAADAPPGCENWYVMINTPPDSGQDWTTWITSAREVILKKLHRILGVNPGDYIACEKIVAPLDIEEGTWSEGGSLYGSASNSILSSFLRHPNFSRRIKNLYFVGGSVHPGGGIPLCFGSAKIVDKLISKT